MKKLLILFTLTLTILSNLSAQTSQSNIIPGECLVMLHGGADKEAFLKSVTQTSLLGGFELKQVISERYRIYLLAFNPALYNQEQALFDLQKNSYVAIAQYNHTIQDRATPNDPNFTSQQWDMNNTGQTGGVPDADIDGPEAWDITTGGLTALGDTIVVAVVDGGVYINHPDLVPNIWRNYGEIPGNGIDDDGNGYIDDINGWDAYNNDGSIPTDNHGTHVAGTIGARGDNSAGVTGVNWNVKIMSIAASSGSEATVIRGYGYVAVMRERYNNSNGTTGAFVVSTNASFGVDFGQASSYPLWCAFYDTLGAVGILNAGAGPNANTNIDTQGDIPTTCPSQYLIAVTNTTNMDAKNNSAGYGTTNMDIGAPGTSIYSTYGSSSYQNLTGTSMATPHVTGAIGLYWSAACPLMVQDYKANPSALALQMRTYLLTGVDSISSMANTTSSKGRLNVYKGILKVQSYNCSGQPPVAGFISSTTTVCAGDTVYYTDQSTDATSWAWTFPGGTPNTSAAQDPVIVYSAPGTYNVKLVTTNTMGSDSVVNTNYITVNAIPLEPVITNVGGTLQSSYATGNQWYNSSDAISGASGQAYVPSQNDVYTVVYTDANGCTSVSEPFLLNVGVENETGISFSVYPSPTTGIINIKGTGVSGQWKYRVMDITGKVLLDSKVAGNNTLLNISAFVNGIYLIEIQGAGFARTFRIVKM